MSPMTIASIPLAVRIVPLDAAQEPECCVTQRARGRAHFRADLSGSSYADRDEFRADLAAA
jgi:hypothetical protein